MVVFPHCKINLGLYVLNKRTDGYHSLSTCFYPVPWTDVLEIIESNQLRFTTSGIVIPGSPNTNLCWRAYELVAQKRSIPPVHIHLHKVVPMGAGLGGGSSDGAFTLRLLNDKFKLDFSKGELMEMASQLGSDCPFFVQDEPQVGSGRGEILEPISLSLGGTFIVMVKPDIHISTKEAYSNMVPKAPDYELRETLLGPVSQWPARLGNDFELGAMQRHPAIRAIKERLYSAGAFYAGMSGSGSAVFGLFRQEIDAAELLRGMSGWSGWLR